MTTKQNVLLNRWYKKQVEVRFTQNAKNGVQSVPKSLLRDKHLGELARLLTVAIAKLRGQRNLFPNIPLEYSHVLRKHAFSRTLPKRIYRFMQVKVAIHYLKQLDARFTLKRLMKPNDGQREVFAAAARLADSCFKFKRRLLNKQEDEIILFDMDMSNLQNQTRRFFKGHYLTPQTELDNGMTGINPELLKSNLKKRALLKMRLDAV